MNEAETDGCANVVARSWLSERCCERVEFVTVSVKIQSEEFLKSGCESSEEHMREMFVKLHRTSAKTLGRRVMFSMCS